MADQATAAATAQNDTGASGGQTLTDAGAATEGQETGQQAAATEGAQAEGQGTNGSGEQETQTEGEQTPTEIQDFTMPEGMQLDADLAGELKTFAKEKNLSQEDAQHVADLGVKMLQKQQESSNQIRNDWADASKADKEIGGEKFAENLAVANKAIEAFATPEFVKFLQESGLGNHPEMVRAWHRVGKKISVDTVVTGAAAPVDASAPPEKRMFPDMT